ncbi:uncharacterized protein LOC136089655 [Hydra vulgaris]|uniref:Uncharacterized protein LOC136089655 n=1 Tax=Hydra vulgaris TaxID=6087 RepID=A0ABM4DBN7_HYDVU
MSPTKKYSIKKLKALLMKYEKYFGFPKEGKQLNQCYKKCVICKFFQEQALSKKDETDLPEFRIQSTRSFKYTGLDYAGPLIIKEDNDGANVLKVYVLLLTCATIRAIRLELTNDLQAPSFLRALRRFILRRGSPEILISDNAKTFKFILPASPWWGGFYERLVRSVKLCLKKTLHKQIVTYDKLASVLCEVEYAINQRPLVYNSDYDLCESLCVSFDVCYLNELRQYNLYRKDYYASNNRQLVKGDIVLIEDENKTPRGQWRIGKIEKLIAGRDGDVREAKLAVISKEKRRTKTVRPLQKLNPLEVSSTAKNVNVITEENNINNSEHFGAIRSK